MRRSILHALSLVAVLGLAALASGFASPSGASSEERAPQPSCPSAGLTSVPNGQLRIPAGAKPGATPLLVAVMSGGDGDRDDYLQLGRTANRAGIAVLYPTGRAGPIWQISDAFGSSDVALVSDLLDRVVATGCFNPRRISITGVSNGAGFATRMACKLRTRFAAVVTVAGGFRALDPCPGVRASFLAIHGDADTVVPFYGRPPDYKGNVLRYTSDWARRDGCSTTALNWRPRRDVTRFDFGGCASGLRTEVLQLHGTDHGWPGAPPPFPSRNPSGVDGNAEVVRFVRNALRPS